MRCRRAFETDLLAVLRGEGGDVDFLAHYPTCGECAAELRVWGELDAMLRTGAPAAGAHPSEEALLAFVDAPATLANAARAEVEHHLVTCRTCADEVGSLRHFDPARVTVAAAVPSMASEPRASWLGRLLWHPAFAYALVAALLVPLVRSQLGNLSVPARVLDARREPPQAPAPIAKAAPAPPAPPEEEARARQAPAQSARRAAELDSPALAMREASPEPAKMRMAEKKAEGTANRAPAAEPLTDRVAPAQPGAAASASDGAGAPELAGQAGALAPAPTLFVLRVGAPGIIPFGVAASGPLLQILAPGFGASPVEVQVRARAGARELTQRITPHANAIVLQIPPRWLTSGDYTLTLTPVAEASDDDVAGARPVPTPMTLGFTVTAPSTGR